MKLDVKGQEDPRFVPGSFPMWNHSRRITGAQKSGGEGGCVLGRVTHRFTEP